MKITPRIYQKIATKAALKGLRGRLKRALVVLATGLGKTLTAAFIMKELRPKRVLFLVHNNFILDHAMGEFRLAFGEKLRIAVFNGLSKDGAAEADMVFATWQTMGRNLKVWKRNHFDLIIVDEAHHTEAETYLPVMRYFTGAKLGITATPDREDEADIRNVFGSEVINVTLEEAIARGWLPRIEYHVVTDESLDDEALQEVVAEIRESKRRFTMAEVNRRIFIRKRDREIARIVEGYSEKTIVFCPSISYADRVGKFLRLSAVFHSSTGKNQKDTWDKNQKALSNLRDGIVRRVCAVNAFNEGVNVPTVGLIAFCRATESNTIFRQQLGRGLRPGKDKLIVLDFVGNLERIQLVIEMMQKVSDLHERYTSKEARAREGYQRQRFEVSGKGFEFTFTDKIVDLMTVLEHCEREFYPTWQEASRAAIRLGITSQPQYIKGYKEDERLSSYPDRWYADFPGWPKFLGKKTKDFYPTWQEAGRAAIELGILFQRDYQSRYKEDQRLPSNPPEFYDDFPNWLEFFGKKTKNFYPTWRAAAEAALRLGIHTKEQYKGGYKRDARLTSRPEIVYPDFPGWPEFFGRKTKNFYPTWRAAAEATLRLGIHSINQYFDRYMEDGRLPATPSNKYVDFPGWPEFFGRKAKNFYSTWQEAGRAAMKLGITSREEYNRRYKEDKHLPSLPAGVYSNYPGMEKFLGKNKEK